MKKHNKNFSTISVAVSEKASVNIYLTYKSHKLRNDPEMTNIFKYFKFIKV